MPGPINDPDYVRDRRTRFKDEYRKRKRFKDEYGVPRWVDVPAEAEFANDPPDDFAAPKRFNVRLDAVNVLNELVRLITAGEFVVSDFDADSFDGGSGFGGMDVRMKLLRAKPPDDEYPAAPGTEPPRAQVGHPPMRQLILDDD